MRLKFRGIIWTLVVIFSIAGIAWGAQLVIDNEETYDTPQKMMQAADDNFDELYLKWTNLGATHDTSAELDALYEAELDNSAGLAAALSDETGTGVAVFATSPTLVTPALGTIASGVGTALTALNGENIQDDTIDEDSIDWGSGADQIDLADIPGGVASASVFDFGGATSFEIPNGTDASPSVAGQIRHDSVVTGLDTGALAWYDGDEVRYLVDLDVLPSDDAYVVAYSAANDNFYMKADSTGAGGDQLVDIVATSPLLVNATTNVNDALPGSDADITFSMPAATNSAAGYATAAHIQAIEANTAKNTNVSTSLSLGTVGASTIGITSDGGADDVTLPAATTDDAGLLTAALFDEIAANTAKTTALTQEQVEDYIGGMVTGNTETNITVTYQDADGTLDFVVSAGGDVTAASNFGTDNVLIKSDGTSKGTQATGITVADTTNNVSGVGTLGCGAITSSSTVTATGFSTGSSTTPQLELEDATDDADGEIKIIASSVSTDTYDSVLLMQVDEAGVATTYLELDGANTSVDFLKPTTLQTGDIITADLANDAVTMDKIDDDGNFTDLTGNWTTTGAITGGTVTDGTVTLAGDGTITGLSAGGLPDNSIDSGCIANDAVTADKLDDDGNFTLTGTLDFGGASLEIPNTASGDQTLTEGMIGQKSDEDLITFHGGSTGEVQDEAGLSLIQHIAITFDPAYAYDQNTNHILPLFTTDDDMPHGITITEWKFTYVTGDPTTEFAGDLVNDSDWTSASATVNDVLDTTTGASTADTGFDAATIANGRNVFITMDSDPTDANVQVLFELWYYVNED